MKNRNRVYTNGEITIFWRAALCVHNTQCFRNLRTVFDPAKRPWVNPNGAESMQIKEVIEQCPTDALTFKWNDPERNANESSPKLYLGDFEQEFLADAQSASSTTTAKPGAKVNIRPNGPIVISGDFVVVNSDGQTLRPQLMTSLCRCGQTRNMPFCDGTHFKINFKG